MQYDETRVNHLAWSVYCLQCACTLKSCLQAFYAVMLTFGCQEGYPAYKTLGCFGKRIRIMHYTKPRVHACALLALYHAVCVSN